MRLLLDTHLVLWWQAGSPRLPRKVMPLVDQADVVFVSRVSLWEIAIKVSIGKLRLDIEEFAASVEQTGFEWLDIRHMHLITVASMPLFNDHKDPFDRLLIAQSQCEPLLFLSADQKLARYGETVQVV